MASAWNDRNVVAQLHQTQIDQLPQMVGVDGEQQRPLRLDVSECPNEVNGPQRIHPGYFAYTHSALILFPNETHPGVGTRGNRTRTDFARQRSEVGKNILSDLAGVTGRVATRP